MAKQKILDQAKFFQQELETHQKAKGKDKKDEKKKDKKEKEKKEKEKKEKEKQAVEPSTPQKKKGLIKKVSLFWNQLLHFQK